MPRSKLFIVPKEPTERSKAPNNLPIEPSRLVGREKEVEAVLRVLSDAQDQEPHVRLLTLVGPGGVGKTRLALQVAQEMLEEFEDGVYFVELAPIVEAGLVAPTIATALQVREDPGVPLLFTLKAHLHDKRILLVLDNFEQVIQAGSALSELLAACPSLKLLVTSRTALGLRAEHVFEVTPLAIPERSVQMLKPSSVQTLLQYGAIELFVQRASTLESEFELTSDNTDAVIEICRRVDGLPLAIELVAAHARLLSPQSILARLTHPLRLLTGGPQDAPGRHRTMRDTIEWSYRLLNQEEQRLFRRLSVFVGGFSVRVAEAVCNEAGDIGIEADDPQAIEVLEGLEALVDKNLLRRLEQTEDGDRRLTMLEMVREYAWEQLAASGEAQVMRRRHADYYLSIAPQAQKALEGKELTLWLPWLDRNHDNLRAALNWLLEQEEAGTAEDVLQLLVDLRVFWDGRANPSECERWLEKALVQVRHEATPLRIKALIRGSIYARKRGDYSKSKYWVEQALATARQLGDKRQITNALSAMSVVELVQGNYSAARSLMEETLAVYRELGVDVYIASTLNNLGEVARYQSDYESAERFYRESLGLFRAMEDKTGIMVSVDNLGHATHHLGNFKEAKALYLEAVILAQEIDAPGLAAAALTGLAGVTLAEIDQLGDQNLRGVEQTARLCGLAAGLLERKGRQLEQLDQIEFEHNVAAARAMLGEEAFTKAWEEGRVMTLDQALELATQDEVQIPKRALERAEALERSEGEGFKGKRPKSKRGFGGLTSREYEVVGLVTQGLSNEDIARRLVLSERTVEMHVSNALHKLGLTTRTQLAAWAVEQGIAPGPT